MSGGESTRPATAPEVAAAGEALARAREALGLAVADVAARLKLSPAQVEALEAGEFDRLPGPVFVRGFIRNYARLVRLDAEPLLRAAAQSLPRRAALPEAPPSHQMPFPEPRARRWPVVVLTGLAFAAAIAFYEFSAHEPARLAMPPLAVAPAAAPAQAAAAPEQPAAGAMPVAADEPQPGAAEAAEPGAGGTGRRLRFVFRDDSWVEVRDGSGRTIFSQLNRAGTEQVVEGLPPLSLVVGNAHGVRLTYEDRPVDLAPHTRVDVARLTLE